jgi:hypothetical protein
MWICNKSNRLNNTLILTKLTQNELINKNPSIDFSTIICEITTIKKEDSPIGVGYYEVLVRNTNEKAAFELYKFNEYFLRIQ